MSFVYSGPGRKYFLEIKGRTGKLYLDRYRFGNDEFQLDIDGHKSLRLMSPIHFDVAFTSSTRHLIDVLREYHHPMGPGSWHIFPEIALGVEYNHGGKIQRTMMHRLFHCRVMRIQGRKKSGDSEFEIDFLRHG